MSDRPSLALDIGTRKVVGLLTVPGRRGLKIIAAERLEHATRAMFDGQIHDVAEVAGVVSRIVQKLSAKAGFPLTEAAVAAAGRALRTFKGTASRELSGLNELTAADVFALELAAVQVAQSALAAVLREREKPQDYHYVGHSVMGARLDGLPIGNLVGQRGNRAELDVIGTFLPRAVVDSLQSVLERTGLEMTALTLEPIAALSVAVPQTMRHLNLVLVDIGAGTSDIAITSKGTVTAYDMVPIAGDEITEALSEAYLLDFTVGEAVKRKLRNQGEVGFTDILGQTHTLDSATMVEALRPAVERLAREIADRVLRLNGTAPQAMMLVGGGSLTPGLPAALAAAVGLPEGRVAVRGRDAIAGVDGAKGLLKGPDAVTPIGIAVTSRERSTLGFAHVYVGTHGVRLFHPAKLTVADALLAAGVAIGDLQGAVGKGLTVTVNGSLRIVRGTFGRPARILLNDQVAALDSPIVHKDHVTVVPGTAGEPGRATVGDVAPEALERLDVMVNGAAQSLEALITVNGQVCDPTRALSDNDCVVVRPVRTVEDVLLHVGMEDLGEMNVVRFSLDGVTQVDRRPRYTVRLNGALAGPETPLRSGDQLAVASGPGLTVGAVAAAAQVRLETIRIRLNGMVLELHGESTEILRNGRRAEFSDPVGENDAIAVVSGGEPPIFAHLLAQAGFGTTPPPGKARLTMLLNGQPAEFVTPLKDGDRAELIWE